MTTQQELAEYVREWMGTAFDDCIVDLKDCPIDGPDRSAAMVEGVTRFVADLVLAGSDAASGARPYVADYVCQRITAQVAEFERGRLS